MDSLCLCNSPALSVCYHMEAALNPPCECLLGYQPDYGSATYSLKMVHLCVILSGKCSSGCS